MDTHKVILGSKDKLRFHLVGRLETGTNSFVYRDENRAGSGQV
jgi:hypothetical protein